MYFKRDRVGVTDGAEIVDGFCYFYCQVWPKLAAKLDKVWDGPSGSTWVRG